jgi:hypothetical protein
VRPRPPLFAGATEAYIQAAPPGATGIPSHWQIASESTSSLPSCSRPPQAPRTEVPEFAMLPVAIKGAPPMGPPPQLERMRSAGTSGRCWQNPGGGWHGASGKLASRRRRASSFRIGAPLSSCDLPVRRHLLTVRLSDPHWLKKRPQLAAQVAQVLAALAGSVRPRCCAGESPASLKPRPRSERQKKHASEPAPYY